MSHTEVEEMLEQIRFELEECLSQRRKVLLDIFEGIFEHTEQWPMMRQKLLKFFGDSGIRGDFLEVIENAKRRISHVDKR